QNLAGSQSPQIVMGLGFARACGHGITSLRQQADSQAPHTPSSTGDQDRTKLGGQTILFELAQSHRGRRPCRKHKGLLVIKFARKGEKHLTWYTSILAIATMPGNAQSAAKVRGQHFVS